MPMVEIGRKNYESTLHCHSGDMHAPGGGFRTIVPNERHSHPAADGSLLEPSRDLLDGKLTVTLIASFLLEHDVDTSWFEDALAISDVPLRYYPNMPMIW
ncbi:hypothetical protein [Xaviernesmea oryzae]|uniref:hypothetical protein n=1 Tax=Xaviernesmea oryzae TaxID=464029 RepID=UPI0011135A47|nr:hypothetical protein [Xaviernesmea oryzae]